MENDWSELETTVASTYPRLEPLFGHCWLCRKTATRVVIVGEETWSICGLCGMKWRSPTALLFCELDLARELEALGASQADRQQLEDLVFVETWHELASLGNEEDYTTKAEHEVPVKASETAPLEIPTDIDPRIFFGPKDGLLWPKSRPDDRAMFLRHVMADLREHPLEHDLKGLPDVRTWSGRCWDRIRDFPVRPDGTTVDQWISKVFDMNPTSDIETLVRRLLAARARRAQLVAELSALDAVDDAFPSAPLATR